MRRYPHDSRQNRAAEGLLALARFVDRLPAGDARPDQLILSGSFDRGFNPCHAVDDAVTRFRLDDPDELCDAFLNRLVQLASIDRDAPAPADPAIQARLQQLAVAALRAAGHERDRGFELLALRLASRRPEDAPIADLGRSRLLRAIDAAMPLAWVVDERGNPA